MRPKFSSEELEDLKRQDMLSIELDQTYITNKYDKALVHNEAIDYFTNHDIKFEIVLQNYFRFWHKNQSFFYYAIAKKFKKSNYDAKVYHVKNINHMFEILNR